MVVVAEAGVPGEVDVAVVHVVHVPRQGAADVAVAVHVVAAMEWALVIRLVVAWALATVLAPTVAAMAAGAVQSLQEHSYRHPRC